jgi:hypothetical protein
MWGVLPSNTIVSLRKDKILENDLAFVTHKLDEELDNGFSSQAFLAGRSVFVDCFLDNIANYPLNLFILSIYRRNHHMMDMSRARLFGDSIGVEKRVSHGEMGKYLQTKCV